MKTIKIQRCTYLCLLLTAAIVAALFESDLLTGGLLEPNGPQDYWTMLVGIALVLVCIPLALKWMTLRRVKAAIGGSEMLYGRHSLLRLALLGLPLLYNTLLYYLSACEPTYGYMALMTVVAFLFVWPSEDKMHYELANNEAPVES